MGRKPGSRKPPSGRQPAVSDHAKSSRPTEKPENHHKCFQALPQQPKKPQTQGTSQGSGRVIREVPSGMPGRPRGQSSSQAYSDAHLGHSTRSLARANGTYVESNDNVQQSNQTSSSGKRKYAATQETSVIIIDDSDSEQPANNPRSGKHEDDIIHSSISARRRARIARFDSEAFDWLIYKQEGATTPPAGVCSTSVSKDGLVKPGTMKLATSSGDKGSLYLPVNPSIHRPYLRTQVWQDRKDQEIQSRKGRKEWFGKVVERQKWLQLEEKLGDEKPVEDGDRKDPEPWKLDRPLDFADVPESELPEYVRNNPAWLQACRWQRELKVYNENAKAKANNKSKKRKKTPRNP